MIFILPGITLLLFVFNLFCKGNTIESCVLFILTLLPLINLKITTEAYGGFRIFDALAFYMLIFLFRDFISNLDGIRGRYLLLFILLMIIILIGGLASEFPARAYLNTVKTLPVFIFARFFLIQYTRDPAFVMKVVRALKISYIVSLVFLLAQVIIGLKFTFYPSLNPNTIDPVFHMVRYPGIFYDSQANGQYLIMGCFLFMYTGGSKSNRDIIFNYIIFGLGLAGTLLAGSRSAFGGFIAGLLVLLFVSNKTFRIYGTLMIVFGFLILKAVAPDATVFERTRDLSEDYKFRATLWKDAFTISKEHPLLGIGTDNYQHYVMRHAQNQYLEIEEGEMLYFDQPENGYLKLLVEWGFIGFGIFLVLVLGPLIAGMFRRLTNRSDLLNSFFIASLVSWMLAFSTVYSIADYRIMIMAATMVLLLITSYSTGPVLKENE